MVSVYLLTILLKTCLDVKSKEYTSLGGKGDLPETDDTEDLDEERIKKHQTMIGCLLWAVSLGRLDIQTSNMTMSHF
jgi:hypothetical protein